MQGRRRFLGLIGLVCVVFVSGYLGAHFRLASAPIVEAAHQFSDVPNSAFYHNAVDFLVANGITSGCSDSPPLYCGGQAVTRGQIALFLERTASLLVPALIDRPFYAFVICAGGVNRFAVVESNGNFVRGSAGTTASRLLEGTYLVSFDINVTACSWQVTVGQTGNMGATTGVANVAGQNGNTQGLFITTRNVVLL